MKNFYLLYQPYKEIVPQLGEHFTQQVAEHFKEGLKGYCEYKQWVDIQSNPLYLETL